MDEPNDTPTRFWIERLQHVWIVDPAAHAMGAGDTHLAWLPVGQVELECERPYARDALVAWAGEQDDEAPLGHYRVIQRGDGRGFATFDDFEIREHRERIIERIEDIPLAEDIATLSRAALTPAEPT